MVNSQKGPGLRMIEGIIKTKDVFLHPISIIQMRGFRGYLKILARSLSPKPHRFISMMFSTSFRAPPKKTPGERK
jgi:hypothetical protein